MKKEIIILIIIIAAITIGIVAWQLSKEDTAEEPAPNITNTAENNESVIELSQSKLELINKLRETNMTELIEEETASLVLNPSGTIKVIDRRDEGGKYFCNDTENPEHKIKVYSYRIMEGTKNLSQKYIESENITNICDTYQNVNNASGMRYTLEWKWDAVEGVDGYKVYQYYVLDGFSREYDYKIEIKTNRILDTGLDLWVKETNPPNQIS